MCPLKNLLFSCLLPHHPSHSPPLKVSISLTSQYLCSVPLCKYKYENAHSPSLTQNVANCIHCFAFLLAIILSHFTKNFLIHFYNYVGFMWFHHNSFIWSSVDGPLDCVQFLLLKKRATVENLILIHSSCYIYESSVQFSSVSQSCPTLCDPMNHSTPGLPVHHHLPEFTQTHVPRVRDAIQPSHSRSSPSPPAPNPSQHQSFFQ